MATKKTKVTRNRNWTFPNFKGYGTVVAHGETREEAEKNAIQYLKDQGLWGLKEKAQEEERQQAEELKKEKEAELAKKNKKQDNKKVT